MTSTGGGLVFTADLAGNVLAFDDRNGTLLWQDRVGMPVGGGIVTYAVRGKQYLAVAAGFHAPMTWKLESPPAELLIYALP